MESDHSASNDGNIDKQLKNMKLTPSPFSTAVDEEENESRTSMTDFELAETDLMECLLRTNIIQRISHILGTIKPENTTVFSCLKILIRIARTSKVCAVEIASNPDLLKTLIDNFLPGLEMIGKLSRNLLYK